MSVDLFREAVKAAHNEQKKTAHTLLQELLLGQPRHELGWLWLSKVSDDLDEQIRALETALTINPDRKETRLRLETLRHQQANHYHQSVPGDIYGEAIEAYKNGRRHRARELLAEIVRADPKHERAWLGLSQLSFKPEEKMAALEMALLLNPQNAKVQTYLQKLKLNHVDNLALGLAYENYGQYGRAITTYQYASKNAPSSTDRHIARKHYLALKEKTNKVKNAQEPEKEVKVTSANANLIRLALGPIIIYLMLLLLHSGLNPLKIPALLYLGVLGVILGSLLTVGAANTPHHPFWQKLLGPEGITDIYTRSVITGLGMLFVLLPYGIILISGLNRLAQLRANIPIDIN